MRIWGLKNCRQAELGRKISREKTFRIRGNGRGRWFLWYLGKISILAWWGDRIRSQNNFLLPLFSGTGPFCIFNSLVSCADGPQCWPHFIFPVNLVLSFPLTTQRSIACGILIISNLCLLLKTKQQMLLNVTRISLNQFLKICSLTL